eukprot:6795722-Karenia_brevis.AAC.1
MLGPERFVGIEELTRIKSEASSVTYKMNRIEGCTPVQWIIDRRMRRRTEISEGEPSSCHEKKIDSMTMFAEHIALRREVKHQVTELDLTPSRCKSRISSWR